MTKQIITLIALVGSIGVVRAGQSSKRTSQWQDAEKQAKNAVVQIKTYHNNFNWTEPYKTPVTTASFGSGFFINDTGDILTNFHVVRQAFKLEVFIPVMGQKPLEATIVGVCPESDVAHIRLTQKSLADINKVMPKVPYLTLGDSDTLFPTEPVLAIGYPNGERYVKCTAGVLAGKEYTGGKSFMHITAPINPGNSGGPLLNLEGKVVGINSAGKPGLQNVGYIIPIFDVKILLNDLSKKKLVTKPDPGIICNRSTKELAQLLGNPIPAGTYIHTVEKGSNADKAGVKAGDMIYAIDDLTVDAYVDVTVNWPSCAKISLDEYLLRKPSQSDLSLTIYRNGEKKTIVIKDQSMVKDPIRTIYPDYEPDQIHYEVIGGLCIMQLRLNHIKEFENVVSLQRYRLYAKKHKKLLVITKVIPGSTFSLTKAFYAGALVTEVNDQQVHTLDELRNALKKSLTTNFIKVKTKFGITSAVSLDKALKDEERLTKKMQFSSTKGMEQLKKARGKN